MNFQYQAKPQFALPNLPKRVTISPLAYSPGVAEPVREIAANPDNAYRYTNKNNTVAVITNGTAILGLGNLGPLASKTCDGRQSIIVQTFCKYRFDRY